MFVDLYNAFLEVVPFEEVELVAAFGILFVDLSLFFMLPFGLLFRLGSRLADWLMRCCAR